MFLHIVDGSDTKLVNLDNIVSIELSSICENLVAQTKSGKELYLLNLCNNEKYKWSKKDIISDIAKAIRDNADEKVVYFKAK